MNATFISNIQVVSTVLVQFICACFSGYVVFAIFKRTQDLLAHTGFPFLFIIFTLLSMICALIPNTALYLFVSLILIYLKNENLSYCQIIFLLWSLINGYAIGKGLILQGLCSLILISGIILYATHHNRTLYRLSITCFDDTCEKQVMRYIQHESERIEVESKNISEQGISLTVNLILTNCQIIDSLISIKGVEKAEMIRRNNLW